MITIARLGLLLAALIVSAWTPALAHTSQSTEIRLDVRGEFVQAEIVVPVSVYVSETGRAATNDPVALAIAKAELADRFSMTASDGTKWSIIIEDVRIESSNGPPDLRAAINTSPPQDAQTRTFSIGWEMFPDELPGNLALVVLEGDSAGAIGDRRTVLGALTPGQTTLEVDLGESSWFTLGANAFLIGVHHILEGYDHLLFLIALMLPAPLIARRGKWLCARRARGAVVEIVTIVTAFTIGHSITLVISTIWPTALDAVLVESLIAMSVLVSAAHAIRPIFPSHEPLVGFGFGLVHGLAFATLLADSGLGNAGGAAALFGFTLGIEAVQLGIAAFVLPALILLAPDRSYRWIRTFAGWAVLLLATLWLVNRTTGIGDRLVATAEWSLSFGAFALAALLALAVTLAIRRTLGNRGNIIAERTP